jgi:hypothetical protein
MQQGTADRQMFPEPAIFCKQSLGAFMKFTAVKRVISVHGVYEAGVLSKYHNT